MYKLCFFVPESHLEEVKSALFEIGAGKIGQYDCCCWQVKGLGQFRPLSGSNPYVGELNGLTKEEEYKVEMVCDAFLIKDVVDVLKETHPYEVPAYEVYKLESF